MPEPEKKEEGETPETPKEEKKEEGEKAKETMSAEEIATSLKARDTEVEELKGRVESLQDSLDSALEEMALKGKAPEAGIEEEEEEEEEGETPAEEKKEEPKKEGEEKGGETVEKEIESAIKEEESFRSGVLLREEVRDLKEELKDVMEIYSEANEDEVLLGVEDGIEEGNPNQVEVLAKASHEKRLAEKEEMKTSLKGELEAEAKKEKEGEISVPQSPGTPKAPQAPVAPGVKSAPTGMPDEGSWDEALEKSKAEGGGE